MSMGGDPKGAPVAWFEVAGRDLDALSQFYGSLFGWRIELDPDTPIPTAWCTPTPWAASTPW